MRIYGFHLPQRRPFSSNRARNLSERYKELALSARQSQNPLVPLLNMEPRTSQAAAASTGLSLPGLASPQTVDAAARLAKIPPGAVARFMYAGLEMPVKPTPPGPEECCMSGCAVCVHDLYIDAMKDYNSDLRAARSALLSLQNTPPKANWPQELREIDEKLSRKSPEEVDDELDASLDPATRAFIEMERRLKDKK